MSEEPSKLRLVRPPKRRRVRLSDIIGHQAMAEMVTERTEALAESRRWARSKR